MIAWYFARKRIGLTTKRAVDCAISLNDHHVVLAQGVPGRNQIDDQIGQSDERAQLDRTVQWDQFDRQSRSEKKASAVRANFVATRKNVGNGAPS